MYYGVPEYLQYPGTIPTDLPHHIEEDQVAMALDTLEQFLRQKHLAGPFTIDELPYEEKNMKFISLFGKARPHGGSLRLINDHSSPPGRSFNDGIPEAVIKNIPLKMGTLKDIITTILLAGKGSAMSKYDLCEAFQTHPTQVLQYPYQAYRILSSIFLCCKMTYGDRQACHRFSRSHEVMLKHLILPQCEISPSSVSMCVDDVCAVVCKEKIDTELAELDAQYKNTLNYLGFETKKVDPKGYKAFHRLKKGEVLGALLNTEDLTWSLSDEKNTKIIEALDETYHKHNLNKPKKINLKTAQKCVGKLNALQACYDEITNHIMFVNRDLTLYLKEHPELNKTAQQHQPKNFQFSKLARKELHFMRALLTGIRNTWIPLTDPDKSQKIMADVVTYTDASAKTELKTGEALPALGILIPPQYGVTARAVALPIPLEFLTSKSENKNNFGQTMLTEALAILAAIIRFPNTYKNKYAVFYTDCQSLVAVYDRKRPKNYYLSFVFKSIMKLEAILNCKIKLTWQQRRSTSGSKAADTLTHQSQADTPEHVAYRRTEKMPYPIWKTMMTSLKYESNTFHKLWPRILKYWRNAVKYKHNQIPTQLF